MYRNSDSPFTSIYRVNVSFTGGYAAINVKASSPTAATEWVLSHPYEVRGLPSSAPYMEVTHSYKLRKQPVWLRKMGKYGARFDVRTLVKF